MINLTDQASENGPVAPLPPPEQRAGAAAASPNGTASGQPASDPAATQAAADPSAAAGRAEEMVDRVAQQVGFFAALATRKLASFAAHTRESLQDFWAEVQDFRHGKKP